MTSLRIKVCGMTDVDNLLDVLDLGVEAIGVISCPSSPRNVKVDRVRTLLDAAQSAAPHAERHWVVRDVPVSTLDAALASGLNCTHVQLHGPYWEEAAQTVTGHQRHAVQVHPVDSPHCPPLLPGCQRLLLDTPSPAGGGTGEAFDWTLFQDWTAPSVEVVLAGGLTPDHARDGLSSLPSWIGWLDLNSGVESRPGIKDPHKVRAFIDSLSS
jgi:phosphoribosylanthranilate isomerase